MLEPPAPPLAITRIDDQAVYGAQQNAPSFVHGGVLVFWVRE